MARISGYFFLGKLALGDPWKASVLPSVKPASHVIDVFVSHLAQCTRSEKRTQSACAMQDNRPLAVGHFLFDSQFEEAARNGYRLGQVALTPFVAFAHVDYHRLGRFDHLARFFHAELGTRRACLINDVFACFRHLVGTSLKNLSAPGAG